VTSERGYTLVEMLVVMAILGFVIAGLTTVFVSGSHAELDMNRRFQAQQQARLALDKLRVDVHCATAAQAQTVNTYPSIKISEPNCSTLNNGQSTVVWCVETSPTMSTRYALYRTTSTANICQGADTSRVLVSDYLTTSSGIFTTPTTIPQKMLAYVQVDLPVSANPTATVDKYELKDTLVARNSQRCSTTGGCSGTASPYTVP
jgi:prepilin-type N-terminal cleavage/methylation domain-containing protein